MASPEASTSMKSGNSSGQTLDMQLSHIVMEDAAFFDARRHSAGQMQGYLHANRLVHRDFKQIRMQDMPFDRIDLKIAQKCGAVRFRLRTSQRERHEGGAPSLCLQNLDQAIGFNRQKQALALPIQHTRDLALSPKLARRTLSCFLSYGDC